MKSTTVLWVIAILGLLVGLILPKILLALIVVAVGSSLAFTGSGSRGRRPDAVGMGLVLLVGTLFLMMLPHVILAALLAALWTGSMVKAQAELEQGRG